AINDSQARGSPLRICWIRSRSLSEDMAAIVAAVGLPAKSIGTAQGFIGPLPTKLRPYAALSLEPPRLSLRSKQGMSSARAGRISSLIIRERSKKDSAAASAGGGEWFLAGA